MCGRSTRDSQPKRQPLFDELKRSLEEGVQFARGELNLRTTLVPARPPALRARDVVRLRHRLHMSQTIFARVLNVSTKTLQSWEQETRRPSQVALRLLQVLSEQPETGMQAAGLRE